MTAVTTARRPPATAYATGYTLSIEDDEALEEADSLPLSPCYGDGDDPSDFCVAWLGSSGILGTFPGVAQAAPPSGPPCQQLVMQDVIFDRAWQISNQAGNLGSILVNGFSISSSQSTVAGQPTQTGAYALQTELVLTANAPAAFRPADKFLPPTPADSSRTGRPTF